MRRQETNLNEKSFCHSVLLLSTIVKRDKSYNCQIKRPFSYKLPALINIYEGPNFQRFFFSDRIWFICSKRENILPLHWIKCTARHISVVTRPHFQIPLNHKIFHYCQLLSLVTRHSVHWISCSSGSDKSPGRGSCSRRMIGTNWETGDKSMLLASVSRGPGPRRWWDGGRVGARTSARHTRTTAWIYHPSQGPDTHGPAAIRCHFRLEQSLSGRGKKSAKEFLWWYCVAKTKLIESTFFKAGTRMIALAVINIKGFLLS